MDTMTNNVPQFETPHSGSGSNKIKLIVIILIILSAIIFNIWYYSNFFKSPVAEVPEVLLPPTEEEKVVIASDLENRVAKISNEDKAAMIQSLAMSAESDVKLEDREATVKSFQN
jgi:hypothetical protein